MSRQEFGSKQSWPISGCCTSINLERVTETKGNLNQDSQ